MKPFLKKQARKRRQEDGAAGKMMEEGGERGRKETWISEALNSVTPPAYLSTLIFFLMAGNSAHISCSDLHFVGQWIFESNQVMECRGQQPHRTGTAGIEVSAQENKAD